MNFFIKNYKKTLLTLGFGLFLFPFVTNGAEIKDLFEYFNLSTVFISGKLIGFAMLLSLTFFIAGVFKYVNAGDSAEKRASGIKIITHGLIALFLAVSVWALVNIMVRTLDPSENINKYKPNNAEYTSP